MTIGRWEDLSAQVLGEWALVGFGGPSAAPRHMLSVMQCTSPSQSHHIALLKKDCLALYLFHS